MTYNSISFLIFFPIVLFGYYFMSKRNKYIWLLIMSYIFYLSSNIMFLPYILVATFSSYVCAKGMKGKNRKILLWLGIGINVGMLCTVKYLSMGVRIVNALLGRVGIALEIPMPNVIVPLGVSFFVFKAISYIVDVYKEKITVEKDVVNYSLYISFFPQLVAGPIARAEDMLKQMVEDIKFDYDKVKNGLLLMLWGYFEKIVIADTLGIMVDTVFENYTDYPGAIIVWATILYGMQIYCDFGGYSHIAIGAAQVLGFYTKENFVQPYFAINIKDFWRRWHISLSSWLRDYIYIPLGGNRCGRLRKYGNLMVTFLVSGIWHGSGINYIVWGALHGLYQVGSNLTEKGRKCVQRILRINTQCFSYRLWQKILTFAMVDLAWLFFRAPGLKSALDMIKIIISDFNLQETLEDLPWNLGLSTLQPQFLLFACVLLFFVDIMREKGVHFRKMLAEQNLVFRWGGYILIIVYIFISIIQNYGVSASNFIYTQF